MGRPRTFDEEAILDRAMLLFWRKGYEATTMNDLVDELGLGRGSIYAAFGDKHRLFLLALGRYLGRQEELLASSFDDRSPALPQLRRLFDRLLQTDSFCSGSGCFSVNSIAELLPNDQAVAELARRSLRKAEETFATQLDRARLGGELSPPVTPAEAAHLLVTLVQGLQIMRKADPDPARTAACLDATFALLTPGPRPDEVVITPEPASEPDLALS
ncbi:TetR/AcrR family transcriptional regulator [Kitasatospora sp. NPDC048540]|uniref:TetR/AcrR family transcriptional regulator n=1 Tax=Kitasatospora sp. NPDC048540 TaxID=3155634 RepID=UPI0033D028C4